MKADPNRARELYQYAASYFGDAEAQYYLGRLYLAGKGAPRDPMHAARWFRLAANKGQHSAQAMLGAMVFIQNSTIADFQRLILANSASSSGKA